VNPAERFQIEEGCVNNPAGIIDMDDTCPDGDADRFLSIVNHVSRQNINLCWHCLCCGGGCPFASHMDLLPNQVIRLVQLGHGHAALRCRTIWLCVGCHTCSSQCPNSIDVAAVMDALRQLAIHDGIVTPEADIYRFHRYIYESIERHGRLNKLEAMVHFKLGSGKIFSDLTPGLKMLTRGKLELLSQKVADRDGLERIFAHYNLRRRSFEPHEHD
jgi:heterodisulfide reductase subunit C